MIQDEIREGIKGQVEQAITVGYTNYADEYTDNIIRHLHSKGVVIKLENGDDLTGCCLARLEPLIKE